MALFGGNMKPQKGEPVAFAETRGSCGNLRCRRCGSVLIDSWSGPDGVITESPLVFIEKFYDRRLIDEQDHLISVIERELAARGITA